MSEIANSETKPEEKKTRRKVGWLFMVLALLAMFIRFAWNGFKMSFKEVIEWIMGILLASGFAG